MPVRLREKIQTLLPSTDSKIHPERRPGGAQAGHGRGARGGQGVVSYSGPLDYRYMTKWVRKAHQSWSQQRVRSKRRGWEVGYTSREFIGWWLVQMRSKAKWKCPTVGRIDHAKGYYFGNVRLEEKADNIRERNARRGNPSRSHRAVKSVSIASGRVLRRFVSKVEAAAHYGADPKTVYNHCTGRTKRPFKFGPKTRALEVLFQWS